jgi:hypothetical protein
MRGRGAERGLGSSVRRRGVEGCRNAVDRGRRPSRARPAAGCPGWRDRDLGRGAPGWRRGPSRRYQGGAWGEDEIIATAATADDTAPELAATPGGDVLVAWDDWNGGLYARWWRGAGWQPIATLSVDHAPLHPVAIDAEGNAIVTYSDERAAYYLADEDRWVDSGMPLDTELRRAAFAGAAPVVVGQEPSENAPHIDATIYR